jgi:hypothetical protein
MAAAGVSGADSDHVGGSLEQFAHRPFASAKGPMSSNSPLADGSDPAPGDRPSALAPVSSRLLRRS